MIDIEAIPVQAHVDQRRAERVSRWRRRKACILFEEVEDVCMRDISWRRGRALVKGDGLGGVYESAVGGEGDARLPVVETSCAAGGDAWD